MQSDRIVNADK